MAEGTQHARVVVDPEKRIGGSAEKLDEERVGLLELEHRRIDQRRRPNDSRPPRVGREFYPNHLVHVYFVYGKLIHFNF